MNRQERDKLLEVEPQANRWIKKILGADEFLNAKERWCLWMPDATEEDIAALPEVQKRLDKVRALRLKAGHPAALKTAEQPHIFMQVSQPTSGDYILAPGVSSERRTYIPIGFLSSNVIATNANYILPNGTLYEFSVLTSLAHNDWMRLVAGRLENRYRYSSKVVYNTFPWPEVTDDQRQELMDLAEDILMTREDYPANTLAELYDPDKMPANLLAAHQKLDQAVDKLYSDKPFKDGSERLSCLLARYEVLVNA